MSCLPASAGTLIAVIKNLFIRDLALQNDYLRQENKILRGKLGKRVPLNDPERRLLVKFGFSARQLRELEKLVIDNQQRLLEAWNEHFGD